MPNVSAPMCLCQASRKHRGTNSGYKWSAHAKFMSRRSFISFILIRFFLKRVKGVTFLQYSWLRTNCRVLKCSVIWQGPAIIYHEARLCHCHSSFHISAILWLYPLAIISQRKVLSLRDLHFIVAINAVVSQSSSFLAQRLLKYHLEMIPGALQFLKTVEKPAWWSMETYSENVSVFAMNFSYSLPGASEAVLLCKEPATRLEESVIKLAS